MKDKGKRSHISQELKEESKYDENSQSSDGKNKKIVIDLKEITK